MKLNNVFVHLLNFLIFILLSFVFIVSFILSLIVVVIIMVLTIPIFLMVKTYEFLVCETGISQKIKFFDKLCKKIGTVCCLEE